MLIPTGTRGQRPAFAQFPQPFRDNVRAIVVKSEPVNQRLLFGKAKDARSRISRLGLGRDRSDLDETEAECFPRRKGDPVLVEARGQTDWIRKGQPKDRFWLRWRLENSQRL